VSAALISGTRSRRTVTRFRPQGSKTIWQRTHRPSSVRGTAFHVSKGIVLRCGSLRSATHWGYCQLLGFFTLRSESQCCRVAPDHVSERKISSLWTAILTRSTWTAVLGCTQAGVRSCVITLTETPTSSMGPSPPPQFRTNTLQTRCPWHSVCQEHFPTGASDPMLSTKLESLTGPDRYYVSNVLSELTAPPNFTRM
jgi:hypothetical protein